MLKDKDFYHLQKIYETNIKKFLKTGVDAVKTTSKKVVHKAGEFLRNKVSDAVTKSNGDKIVKQEPVQEMVIPSEKNIKRIKTSIIKMAHYKISQLLNDWIVSKFETKNRSK